MKSSSACVLIVIFLHRPDRYRTADKQEQLHPGQPSPQGMAEVTVAKHRHGTTGAAALQFKGTTTRFYPYALGKPPPDCRPASAALESNRRPIPQFNLARHANSPEANQCGTTTPKHYR